MLEGDLAEERDADLWPAAVTLVHFSNESIRRKA